MGLETEFAFTLPKGYVDDSGMLHRHGTMRLATARDEIEPLRDPRIGGIAEVDDAVQVLQEGEVGGEEPLDLVRRDLP